MKNLHWHHIRFKLIDSIKDLGAFNPVKGLISEDSPLHYAIANEICALLLQSYSKEIDLWRFHRMQTRETDLKRGIYPQHHFKWKLYCSSVLIKEKIFPKVERHPLVAKLYETELLEDLQVARSDSYSIKDDCDQSWPIEIKEIWPYYICGVSKAWLVMLQSYYQKILVEKRIRKVEKLNFWYKMALYKEIAERMEDKWRLYARHAMFHHANAVFGYKWIVDNYAANTVIITKPGKFRKEKTIVESKKIFMSVKI